MVDFDKFVFVGVLGRTTGIVGEITIVPRTSFPERFAEMKTFFLTKERSLPKTLEVENINFYNSRIVVKFIGIDSIKEAEKLKGYRITINEEDRFELPKDYYYHNDLEKCTVYNEDGEELGKLTKILEMSSNDIYQVDYNGKELLIPAISKFVKKIDIANKKIIVSLVEGMLPDED